MPAMARRYGGELVAVLALSCLLLLPLLVSSRSLHLTGQQQQQQPPSLEISKEEMVSTVAEGAQGLGRRLAARMNVEVNDYPGSGPNTRHDPPKAPGRP
uniref:Uncharacterized protein n=1 Tax=Leersia perrieri TaxID=77586 RepID=A0A0D9WHY1_9ORYZ